MVLTCFILYGISVVFYRTYRILCGTWIVLDIVLFRIVYVACAVLREMCADSPFTMTLSGSTAEKLMDYSFDEESEKREILAIEVFRIRIWFSF